MKEDFKTPAAIHVVSQLFETANHILVMRPEPGEMKEFGELRTNQAKSRANSVANPENNIKRGGASYGRLPIPEE